jgi:hypothetical protein
MDKKSKILLIVVVLTIAGSVFATYYRYFIKKDYYIEAQTDCDPSMEACFVSVCDPETDPECPQEESERAYYYKLIKKKASSIPLCDPNDPDCLALDCSDKNVCEETLCDPENPGEDITCNNPEQYNIDNPEIEETAPDESLDEEEIDSVETIEDSAESDSGSEIIVEN